ncbi:MAG TPA: SRPBCC domain-containing protein, partial [Candidatus Polarisedimenticolia bacterium]|nr:SRPBCC domain-containing protein [Candidatus Polarisedimenticolia bacterium]
MPTQKDPSGRRFIAVETEVPGTPEEVWKAIATGPGITSWFVPTQLEERAKGSMTLSFGPGME